MSALESLRDLVEDLAAPAAPTWIDGMSLFRTERTTRPLGSIARPTLALVLQGMKRSTLGGRVYDYRAGQFLAVGVSLPLVSQIVDASPSRPFIAFGMPLRADMIAALLLEGDLGPAASPTRPAAVPAAPAIAVSDATDELLAGIERLLRLAASPTDYRVLAPGITRELHWRLLTGAQGELVRQTGLPDSRTAVIARAVEWIQHDVARPLRVADLAAHVGLSVPTLNRHFRAVTSLSPLQYQKTMRLQQARLELIASPGDIARVGHAVGYESLSQFSREYRRMFGAPPSVDATRLQPGAAQAAS